MELKVILIFAIVAAITISAHARPGQYDWRGGRGNDRERGGGRFRDGPMGDRNGPRFGVPVMGRYKPNGGPISRTHGPDLRGPLVYGPMGGQRFDGLGFGGGRPEGAGRPFFGQGGRQGEGQHGQGWPSRFDGPGRFSGRPHPGRGPHGHPHGPSHNKTEEHPFGRHNDSSEEDGRPHPRHHHHHHHHDHRNHRHHHHHHNGTEDHHNRTDDGDRDRPMMRPFRFNPFGRKPFGDRPFGKRNCTKEGPPRRDGHQHPHGNGGRWNEKESEEEPTTESVTPSSPPDVVEIDINDIDNNIIEQV